MSDSISDTDYRPPDSILTWDQNIFIMPYEVFQDAWGILDNVDIPPVDPLVHWHQCGVQKIVPSTSYRFSTDSLGLETVTLLYSLASVVAEVFLYNHRASESQWVRSTLKSI